MRIDFEISGGGTGLPILTPDRSGARLGRRALARGRHPLVRRNRRRAPGASSTDEDFLSLVTLLGPLAYVARWVWRCLTRARSGQLARPRARR
jgi:hypothetical protein